MSFATHCDLVNDAAAWMKPTLIEAKQPPAVPKQGALPLAGGVEALVPASTFFAASAIAPSGLSW